MQPDELRPLQIFSYVFSLLGKPFHWFLISFPFSIHHYSSPAVHDQVKLYLLIYSLILLNKYLLCAYSADFEKFIECLLGAFLKGTFPATALDSGSAFSR